MFFLPKYGSAQKENFMEFRFLASSGSFPRQVERLRSLSTSGIGCHWSNKKQAACKLGLFLEEEAFGPGKIAGCYWTMPSGAVVFQSPRVKSGNTWGMPPWATEYSESSETEDQKAPS